LEVIFQGLIVNKKLSVELQLFNPLEVFRRNTLNSGIDDIIDNRELLDGTYLRWWNRQSMTYLLFFLLLSTYYRTSRLLSYFTAEYIKIRKNHFSFLSDFNQTVKYSEVAGDSEDDYDDITRELKDKNITRSVGVQIGIIGKINGRTRAGQYYIVKSFKPALRNIGLMVDYNHTISNSKYGIFGIHV